MSKLLKKLENETDYMVCIFETKSGKFVVTVYDYVYRTHDKQGSYDNYDEALSAAKTLNSQYEINESTVKLTESDLKQIVSETVKKVLKEGTTDTRVQELWEELKQTIGVETMLDCIYDWSSSDDIEQWIGWFEDEGYFACSIGEASPETIRRYIENQG